MAIKRRLNLNTTVKQEIKELRKQGKDVWSFSRLNSYNDCAYGYYTTYGGEKIDRGKGNIYSFAGSEIHEVLEDIYNDRADKKTLQDIYEGVLTKSELLDIRFPNKNIESNWRGNMNHFVENFVKLNRDITTEKQFLLKIDEDIYLQGYIDALYKNEDGTLTILDWKTSSKFTGDSLTKAGRQLLLYKLALEQDSDIKVSKVAWFMLKYLYVCYGNRCSMRERRDWVAKTKNPIIKALKKHGEEDFVCELLFEEAAKNNNLDNLPKEVQDQFVLKDCVLEYEITDERIQECLQYVKNTVKKATIDTKWEPVDINRSTEFFCNILCNHRDTCKYLKIHRGEKVNRIDAKVEKNIMDLFG